MTTTTNEKAAFEIQTTGRSAVLFGRRPDTDKWFERYYPTVEAARKFAEKRGWAVEVREGK